MTLCLALWLLSISHELFALVSTLLRNVFSFLVLQTTRWSRVVLCPPSAHSRGTVATNSSTCDRTQRRGSQSGIGPSQSPSGRTRTLLPWWAERGLARCQLHLLVCLDLYTNFLFGTFILSRSCFCLSLFYWQPSLSSVWLTANKLKCPTLPTHPVISVICPPAFHR